MIQFVLPNNTYINDNRSLVKMGPSQQEVEIDPQPILRHMLFDFLMQRGFPEPLQISWHCIRLETALNFFKEFDEFLGNLNVSLADITEGISDEVLQACNEIDLEMVQSAINTEKNPLFLREDDYYGTQQPAFQPIVAAKLLQDYIENRLNENTVSNGLLEQTPYEQEFQTVIAEVHKERIRYMRELEQTS